MIGLLSLTLLSSALVTPSAERPARQSPEAALASWRTDHGQSWRMETDPATGLGRLLYGGSARLGPAPRPAPRDDAEFVQAARTALRATEAFHRIDDATLVEDEIAFLPLGMIGSTDKTSVQFRQTVGGVPVEGGFANVLFAMDGTLLSVDTTGVPDLSDFDTTPALDEAQASARARELFALEVGLPPTWSGAAELVIDPVVRDRRLLPVLAWKVDVRAALADSDAEGFTYFIDARDGSRVRRIASVHHFDVSGTIRSNATPGDLPDIASNPPVVQDMRHMTVTSSAGTVQTDSAGNFVIPGASPPVSITVQFSGQFAEVLNAAGGRHVVNAVAAQSTGNVVLMNNPSVTTVTAEANAYNWINRLRDWVRAVNPTDAHADFLATANVNLPAPCNAFYDGISVNFFIQNVCVNSAYSSVVVHEMGHWLNDRYNSGNGGDGFGEGNADAYSMYILDTPIVGRNFQGNGYIRTGENTRQFCGDCCGGCYGGVHANGEVLMGALWKVRRRLKTTYGTAVGGAVADNLFLDWMNAYNDSQIRTIIESHWLTLDDDNGNISDGTPHYPEIDGGFRDQGFPGVDINPCPPPANYCIGALNSTGFGATMSFSGSQSVTANDVNLYASSCPPNKFGFFVWSDTQAQAPLANGFRCFGSPFIRFPGIYADGFGTASYHPNLNALPQGTTVAAGDTKYVQFYYRDPAAGGAFANLSDGLRLDFCP